MQDYSNAEAFAKDFLAANPDQQMVHLGNVIVDRAGAVRRVAEFGAPVQAPQTNGEQHGKSETR